MDVDVREPRTAGPLRVLLVGCGAVTRMYYLPSLSRLAEKGSVRVIGVFDPDESAKQNVCAKLPYATPATTIDELFDMDADLAILASPPCLHAPQAVGALNRDLHVLCEKPMAASVEDADRMIAAARSAQRCLKINFVRRQMPAAIAIGQILKRGVLGQLRSIDCFEGGPFSWPICSPDYFDRSKSAGGVFQDIGSHCLDLLTWWLGPPVEVLYEDDEMGGVEANCLVELRFESFSARIRLSRDWARPNVYRFEGEQGSLTWQVNDPNVVGLAFADMEAVADVRSIARDQIRVRSFEDCFTLQIADTMKAIAENKPSQITALSGREVLALVDRCYRERRQLALSWFSMAERERAAKLAGRAP